jgi:TDG/mug DNA glycosylase family protein
VILPDVLRPGLRVVFCGTAAGAASARAGAYYAGPGNRFWPILHATGLTPRLLAPAEFPLLAGWGIGLTDVCKTASGSDREIAVAAFDPTRLRTALDAARPDLVAFTSKTAARRALGLTDAAPLTYGPAPAGLGFTPAWVLPSPSGRRGRTGTQLSGTSSRRWWRQAPQLRTGCRPRRRRVRRRSRAARPAASSPRQRPAPARPGSAATARGP